MAHNRDELQDPQSVARARASLYGLLAYAHSQIPRPGFPEHMEALWRQATTALAKASARPTALKLALEHLAAGLRESQQQGEPGLQELAVEATRLFRGLRPGYGPPPPYESVVRGEEGLAGLSAGEVRRACSEAGYSPTDIGKQPPDSLATELAFMAYLCQQEAEAWGRGEKAEALRHRDAGRRFLREHLLLWGPQWCRLMAREASVDFYRELATLTRTYLLKERQGTGLPAPGGGAAGG